MEKIEALAKHLGIDVESIDESRHDDCLFVVGRRPTKRGTSPTEARRLVAQAKDALHGAPSVADRADLSSKDWSESVYHECAKYLRAQNPTALEKGIHEVLNTLYFLCTEHAGASSHAEAIRAAWDGKEVPDLRSDEFTDDGEYLVLTDDEADDRCGESLESYIDDCMEIPEAIEPYFDRARWKADVIRHDGRGHTLASYDSEEREEDGFYIYRIN